MHAEIRPAGPRRSALCQSPAEEVANSVSHGIGVPLGLAALAVLVPRAIHHGTAWHVVSVSVFGASLVLLYLVSCLYHAVTRPGAKRLLQVLDHAFIFVLIAGTYTPFVLVTLRGPWGWSLFALVWGLALAGIVLKAILLPRYDKSTSFLYVAMGWLVLVALKPLVASLPTAGLAWLVAGGAFYTLGVVFFLLDRIRFAHFVWHLFVLAGSVCHILAVLYGVLPA